MTDLDERLKLLDRIEAPDLWTDVRTRDPRRTGEPPAWNRGVAIAVAAVVATVGIALVARAFLGGRTRHEPINPGPRANGEIAFLVGQKGPGFSDSQIYLMDPDGAGRRQLTKGLGVFPGMTWSPDGKRIAFVQGGGEGGPSNIYSIDASGAGLHQLTSGRQQNSDPAWSPDGGMIAFSSDRTGVTSDGYHNFEIYVMDPDGRRVRRLTSDPALDTMPSWSPDGRRIAFVSNRDGFDIWLMRADGAGATRLTDCARMRCNSAEHPEWSPDGTRVLFVANTEESNEIRVIGADGRGLRTLYRCVSPCAGISDAVWSPDGTEIAFSYVGETGRSSEAVYVMSADGSRPVKLADGCCPAWQAVAVSVSKKPTARSTGGPEPAAVTNGEIWVGVGGGDGPSFEYSVQPDGSGQSLLFSDQNADQAKRVGGDYSFSPDGSRVAFLHWTNFDPGRGQFSAIFSMSPDGSGLTQLTPDGEIDSGPAWSPDGTKIAYASDRAGPFSEGGGCWATSLCPGDIHVMNADGSGDVQLTDDQADDSQPAWSPDGTRIAFVSRRDDPKGDIFVMNVDGSGLTQLTSGTEFDTAARWSPDGSRIAFLSYRDGALDVYTMAPDGSDLRRLTDTGVPDMPFSFAWSPDGTEITYTDGSSMYVMDADGTNQRTIGDFPSFGIGGLAWRPAPAG